MATFGIETTVVTIDPASWSTDRFATDQSHTTRVSSLPTIRVRDHGWRYSVQQRWPQTHKYVWFAAYPALLDYASAWSARIRRQAKSIVRETLPDVVYVSAPPFSSIGAASALAKEANAALVIDYRDPWTTASMVLRMIRSARRRCLSSWRCSQRKWALLG